MNKDNEVLDLEDELSMLGHLIRFPTVGNKWRAIFSPVKYPDKDFRIEDVGRLNTYKRVLKAYKEYELANG